jgi:hypothetical protein
VGPGQRDEHGRPHGEDLVDHVLAREVGLMGAGGLGGCVRLTILEFGVRRHDEDEAGAWGGEGAGLLGERGRLVGRGEDDGAAGRQEPILEALDGDCAASTRPHVSPHP